MKLHNMINVGDRIVLGVSGGADSVALFFLMKELMNELKLKLFVVHINHGIRKEEAKEDADYVAKLCEDSGIPFYLYEADIPTMAKKQSMTEEEMGRVYRYHCFWEVMKKQKAKKLAVAHHMGDQAETVLFHMIRGANLSGVSGMKPISALYISDYEGEIESANVIRPLLQCTKEELVIWLEQEGITWKEDYTNQDNRYVRNRLRNQVLPSLATINNKAIMHIAEFADMMSSYEEFFMGLVFDFIEQEVRFEEIDGEKVYKINKEVLLCQKKIMIYAILYELFIKVAGKKKDIQKEHITLLYELLKKQTGKYLMLPYQVKAEVSYENLIIGKDSRIETFEWDKKILMETIENQEVEVALFDGGVLTMKLCNCTHEIYKDLSENKNDYTKYYDCDKIGKVFHIRTPQNEDFFVMNNRGDKKKLTRYFIDQKFPAWKRKRTIVVSVGHEILWIVGERRCESYKVDETTTKVLIIQYKGVDYESSY